MFQHVFIKQKTEIVSQRLISTDDSVDNTEQFDLYEAFMILYDES